MSIYKSNDESIPRDTEAYYEAFASQEDSIGGCRVNRGLSESTYRAGRDGPHLAIRLLEMSHRHRLFQD
jgi:hypothetical protein